MMTQVLPIRRTFKYRLYHCQKKDKLLHDALNIAGIIWNHCLALQKRYFRLFGKHLSEARLKKHISKLRMRSQKYAYWKKLGSQAVQEVIERLDKAYQRFFQKQGGLPRFKKVKQYKSFTLKQTAGWQLLPDLKTVSDAQKKRGVGQIKIGKVVYKFIKHRELQGTIKTVTVKRDSCGNLWLCFSVEDKLFLPEIASTSEIGGFDFGLKSFLTEHTGEKYEAPEYLKLNLKQIRSLNRAVSRKQKGSKNRQKAKQQLSRSHLR